MEPPYSWRHGSSGVPRHERLFACLSACMCLPFLKLSTVRTCVSRVSSPYGSVCVRVCACVLCRCVLCLCRYVLCLCQDVRVCVSMSIFVSKYVLLFMSICPVFVSMYPHLCLYTSVFVSVSPYIFVHDCVCSPMSRVFVHIMCSLFVSVCPCCCVLVGGPVPLFA